MLEAVGFPGPGPHPSFWRKHGPSVARFALAVPARLLAVAADVPALLLHRPYTGIGAVLAVAGWRAVMAAFFAPHRGARDRHFCGLATGHNLDHVIKPLARLFGVAGGRAAAAAGRRVGCGQELWCDFR